jgi:hypothetical protein
MKFGDLLLAIPPPNQQIDNTELCKHKLKHDKVRARPTEMFAYQTQTQRQSSLKLRPLLVWSKALVQSIDSPCESVVQTGEYSS